MHVRVIALVLPLALGIAACKTSRSTRSSETTAQAETGQSGAQARTEPRTPSEPTTAGSANPSGSDAATAGATGPQGSASGEIATSPSGSPAGSAPNQPSEGAAGTESATPPLAEPSPSTSGSDMTAHSDDQMVNGRITRVSRRSISIASDTGEQKTLALVPETWVRVEGQDAQRADLKEGQEVRASFNQVNGRDVAVMIDVGQAGADQGSSSSMERGTSGTGDTASPSSPDSSQIEPPRSSDSGTGTSPGGRSQ